MKEQKELNNQLEKQKETITILQEKINLLKFDNSRNLQEIRTLKEKLKCRKENVKNIRAELMTMKRTNDFSDINKVLSMLCAGWEDEY